MKRRHRDLNPGDSRWAADSVRRRSAIGIAALGLLLAGSLRSPSQETRPDAGGEKQALSSYLNAQPGVEYVGDQACKGCHPTEYNHFKQTGMGRSTAVPTPEDLRVLTKPVTISSKVPHRTYAVYSRDGKMYHEESERGASGQLVFSETHEIAYAVGSGEVGKSYLVAKGDALFVSPISFYTRIHGWDLSPGYEAGVFRGFTRPVVELCADCHTGQPSFVSGRPNRFQQPPFRSLTIGCERCHGPGAIHVQQRKEGASLGGPIDFAIVNPAKLPTEVRDDVCAQCHFAGDARVLRPGKNYLDFRPGTKLDNVVAIFSVPSALKGTRFIALDQFEQLKMSRCAIASKSRLGCITCHDPHVQLHGVEEAEQFRERCLTCHTPETCGAPLAKRQATAPPDNCVQCHMPKEPLENISHASSADHRILRYPSENPLAVNQHSATSSAELIYDPTPLNLREASPDLRSLALAYTQAVPRYPELGQKGFAVLEQAAREFPDDAEIQASYGLVLLIAQPRDPAHAAETLQRAVALGSKSAEVRTKLGNLRLQQGQVTEAIDLYKDAIQVDSFYTPPYLELARVYSLLKDFKSAREILALVLKVDPGNDAARQEQQKLVSSSDESP